MSERWILAVDLGNGGPKVAAVTLAGEIAATANRGVRVHIGLDGSATQDAHEWWTQLVDGVRELVPASGLAPHSLHAVAITGQYGSTVPVGADGQPAGEVLLWADTRARPYARELVDDLVNVQGYGLRKILPFIRVAGAPPNPNGADPTGQSLLLQNVLTEVYARTRVLLEPVDYLGLRFTGRAAATPASILAWWLTDNRIGAPFGYSDDMVRRTRRDRDRLPELLPTGSVLGPLLPEVADELGIGAGVPVVCGIPDIHAAIVGSGAVAPFATHLAVSTTAWLSTRVPFKKTDILHSIASLPGLDPAYHIVLNNQETGGAALQWMREQIVAPHDRLRGGGSGIGAEGAAPELARPSFDDLTALAATAPVGSEGVLFTPWLAGERSPVEDKNLRASFLNMSLRTTRATLVRAVMEGVALNVRWLFDPYEKFLGRRVESVRILGGGAQSDLWCAMHAGALDRPVEQVAEPRHAQLRGVALWARIALGELRLDELPAMVPVAQRFEPTDRAEWKAMVEEYRRLYSALKGISRRATTRGA